MTIITDKEKKERVSKYARRLIRKRKTTDISKSDLKSLELSCFKDALERVKQEELQFSTLMLAFQSRCQSQKISKMLVCRLLRFRFPQAELPSFVQKVSSWPQSMTEDELEVHLHETIGLGDSYWDRLTDDEQEKVTGAFERQTQVAKNRLLFAKGLKRHRSESTDSDTGMTFS